MGESNYQVFGKRWRKGRVLKHTPYLMTLKNSRPLPDFEEYTVSTSADTPYMILWSKIMRSTFSANSPYPKSQYAVPKDPNTPYLRSSICRTVFRELPYPFDYPMRRLTIEEILAKFIDEGRRKHEEMEIFIKEFRITNELLLKTRSNLLSELKIKEKPHDDGVENKSSSILEKAAHPLVKLQQSSIHFPNRKHKEAKDLAADHLSRFESPHIEVLTEMEIADKFSDEHLMELKSKFKDDEPWYADFVNYIVGKVVPPNWTFEKRKRFFSQVKTYFWEEPYAFRLCADNIMRRCVDGIETLEILAHCHSGPTGGDHSANVTAKKVYESGFYWPSVFKDANEGPFPNSRGNKYILVVVDYVSKWVEAQALPTNDARVVVKFLRSLFARFGVPKALISDRGTHFWCTPFRLVYGKACHLPIKIKHKAHWALKQCHMDLMLASKSRLMQLNELAELRDGAYENTRIYKERTKKWHDSRLRGDKDFKDLTGKEIDKVGKVSIICNPMCVVVMLDIRDNIRPLSDDPKNISEDEEFRIFGDMFGSDEPQRFAYAQNVLNEIIDHIDEPRRSNRKTAMPRKLGDYVLDKRVKYGIDKSDNYSNLNLKSKTIEDIISIESFTEVLD
ncbi:reverse transcriptase domain-containing protein [Tanacetum coccineum]